MMLIRRNILLILLGIAFPRWAPAAPSEPGEASHTAPQTKHRNDKQNQFKDTFDLIYFGNTKGVSAHQSINHLKRLDSLESSYSYRARGPYAYVCKQFIIARAGRVTIADFRQALLEFISSTEPGPPLKLYRA